MDDFRISDAKLNVSVTTRGGKSVPVPLPDIELKDLGTGPDGITVAELTKRVLQVVQASAAKAAAPAVADLSKQAADLTKDAANAARTRSPSA